MTFESVFIPIGLKYGLNFSKLPNGHYWASYADIHVQVGFNAGTLYWVLWNPRQSSKPTYTITMRTSSASRLDYRACSMYGRLEHQQTFQTFSTAVDFAMAVIVEEIKFERIVPF